DSHRADEGDKGELRDGLNLILICFEAGGI
ncbi:unnamed protein product, partial [marine sediment metagenome]